jgi:hypothetical protein
MLAVAVVWQEVASTASNCATHNRSELCLSLEADMVIQTENLLEAEIKQKFHNFELGVN